MELASSSNRTCTRGHNQKPIATSEQQPSETLAHAPVPVPAHESPGREVREWFRYLIHSNPKYSKHPNIPVLDWSQVSYDGYLLRTMTEMGFLPDLLKYMGMEKRLSVELAPEIKARLEDADRVRIPNQENFPLFR